MSSRVYAALLALIAVIGTVRIIATYRVFCETFDEPVHIAGGIEWIDRGTYREDKSHPPLARISAAMWPYLSGIRLIRTKDSIVDGNYVLFANDQYLTNLSRARSGILPFFIVATLFVAAWARRLWGDVGGLAAALLFSNEPNILAHSGLTTTDMAAVTLTVAAAYVFWRFLDSPGRGVILGITVGLAVLSKFSTLLFVPVACAAILIVRGVRDLGKQHVRAALPAAVIAVVIIALGYRVHELPQFFRGIQEVRDHARSGHLAYLFGEWRQFGWWYYFPVAIAVKTTIAFLIVFATGAARVRTRDEIAPLAAGLAILLSSLPVSINIGVRHVLPVYPFFAIAAAGAVVAYRRIGIVLCAAAVIASLAAHPDYLPYFNAFAGPRPDRILVDSNLDWGQDLLRLRAELRRRHIDSIALAYAGNAQPDQQHMPRMTTLEPLRYRPGWAAISEVFAHSDGPQYRWLDRFNPVMQVGKSIRLYYLPTILQLTGTKPVVELTSATRTPILLPVWFGGTFHGANTWACDLTIENDGGNAITIESPSPVEVPPAGVITNPNLGITDGSDGALIHVKPEDTDRLHFALTIRSSSGQTIPMPVIRERDFRSAEVRFASVPMIDTTPATLRVYDVTGAATNAMIRLVEPSGTSDYVISLRKHGPLSSNTVSLNRMFPGRNLTSARIVVVPPSGAFWAGITVNDRATNHSYVIFPD